MSTPLESEVRGRRESAAALLAWADALKALLETGDASFKALGAAAPMRHGDETSQVYEQGRILAVTRMLGPIEEEARLLGQLWARCAGGEESERQAATDLRRIEVEMGGADGIGA